MNNEIQNKSVTNLVPFSTAPKRGRGNPAFVKGQSGNPGGRPKLTDEQKQIKFDLVHSCRLLAPEALEVLKDLMDNAKQDSVKLAAAQAIMERAYGKAVQPTDNTHRDGDSSEFLSPLDAYKLMLGDRSAMIVSGA